MGGKGEMSKVTRERKRGNRSGLKGERLAVKDESSEITFRWSKVKE